MTAVKSIGGRRPCRGLNTRTIIAVIVIISGRERTIFVHFGDEGTVDLRMMALRSLEEKSVQCKFTC